MPNPLSRVLIVDDEPRFISYYVESLQNAGVEVDLLTSPDKARRHIQEKAHHYDVIVVDLIMSCLEYSPIDDLPVSSYVEQGLAMGRWVLDSIPAACSVVVLTNRDSERIDWIPDYRERFAKFIVATKGDTPAFSFYQFLSDSLAGGSDRDTPGSTVSLHRNQPRQT